MAPKRGGIRHVLCSLRASEAGKCSSTLPETSENPDMVACISYFSYLNAVEPETVHAVLVWKVLERHACCNFSNFLAEVCLKFAQLFYAPEMRQCVTRKCLQAHGCQSSIQALPMDLP